MNFIDHSVKLFSCPHSSTIAFLKFMVFSSIVKNSAIAAIAVAALGFGVPGKAQAQTFIDTTPNWDGSLGQPAFTEDIDIPGNFQTVGQTFTVGTDNILNEFSFWLDDIYWENDDYFDFGAYVMEWDSTNNLATGNILYQSGLRSTTGATGMEKFVFNTGGTTLTSGKQYVAFLSTSEFYNFFESYSSIGYVPGDVYDGGNLVYLRNSSNFSAVTTQEWLSATPIDLAFQASFSGGSTSVPEPSTLLGLLTFGTLGSGLLLKRNQHKV